jgi:hypothetical protein
MINDELQQFQKLLEENNKQLRQEIREDIRAEVDPLHERLDAQQKRLTTVEKIYLHKSALLQRTSPQLRKISPSKSLEPVPKFCSQLRT